MKASIYLWLAICVVASACGQSPSGSSLAKDSRSLTKSSTHHYSWWNEKTFNSGNSFEYLVNPTFTRNGELAAERVSERDRGWLDKLDVPLNPV